MKSDKNQKTPRGAEVGTKCCKPAMVPPADLKPHPRNPNHHPPAQVSAIASAIRARGFRRPVIVSKRSGFIITGHGSVLAALEMKLATVPVDYQDFADDAEELAHMVADNKLGLLSEINDEELAALLKDLPDIEPQSVGFTDAELEEVVAGQPGGDTANPKLEEADALAKKWKTKLGQLWTMGKHRLLCGDSSDDKCLQRLLAGDKPGVAVLDPPWEETEKWVRHIMDPCIVMGKGKHIRKIPEDLFRFERVIDKGRSRGARGIHTCVFNRHGLVAQCGSQHARPPRNVGRTFDSIYTATEDENHPHEKPIELLIEHLHYFTPKWEMVFDPYAGSGSTIFAAEQMKRRCCAMELSPGFCAVILQRWQDTYGTKPTLSK